MAEKEKKHRWAVQLSRPASHSCTVEVWARDVHDAKALALDVVGEYGENFDDWSLDDCNTHEVSFVDVSRLGDSDEPAGALPTARMLDHLEKLLQFVGDGDDLGLSSADRDIVRSISAEVADWRDGEDV